MVGGGNRRGQPSLVIKHTNAFAALEKKKLDKKSKETSKVRPKAPEPQLFWAPAPLKFKSWADVVDDDVDDPWTPIQPVWPTTKPQPSNQKQKVVNVDESDSEEEDEEPEAPVHTEPVVNKPAEVPAPLKEAEKQLSKKERKKKELAELEALIADFKDTQKESDIQEEDKGGEPNEDVKKKEKHPAESKICKKKKKKDKASKNAEKESEDDSNNSGVTNYGPSEAAGTEHTEEDTSTIDVKERLKKMAAANKKKKGTKELDAAEKASAQEAAVRKEKVAAAAKKKSKKHYDH